MLHGSDPHTLIVESFHRSDDASDDLAWQRAVATAAAAGRPTIVVGTRSTYSFRSPVSLEGLKNCVIGGTAADRPSFAAATGAGPLPSIFWIPTKSGGASANIVFQYFSVQGGMTAEPDGFARDQRPFGKDFVVTPIRLNGNLVPGEATNSAISNVTIDSVRFYGAKSLPVLMRGITTVAVTNCEFERNLDPGFTFCAGVTFVNNSSKWSGDNGVSLSRGCSDVICTNNRISGSWHAGIFAGGWLNFPGPTRVTISNNILSELGSRGIYVSGGTSSVLVSENAITSVHRGIGNYAYDELGTGISVTGMGSGSPTIYSKIATDLNIERNTIVGAEGWGIRFAGVDGLTISENIIRDIGSAQTVKGVPIARTDLLRNIAIGAPAGGASTNVAIIGNRMTDTRVLSLMNAPIIGDSKEKSWLYSNNSVSTGQASPRTRISR
jgi:hypothetical protein